MIRLCLIPAQVPFAVLTAVALFFSGCQMPPYSALFDPSPEAEGTGIVGVGLVRAVVIIAKYQATDRQRQVAEQNGRAAYRQLVARQSREGTPRPSSRSAKRTGSTASEPSKPARGAIPKRGSATVSPAKPAEEKVEPEQPAATTRATAKPKKLPRYIAVDTVRDERSSPKAKKAVMIWDTQAEEIVGNNVYDLEATPPPLTTARFETYSAQYVGSGSF